MTAENEGNVHQGHRQRLRQRCLDSGLDSFKDHEVLELLLFYALPYRDTNQLAHRLLQHFGSISAVLNADYHELLRIEGVGGNTAFLLTMLPDFFRRYQLDSLGPRVHLPNSAAAGDYAICLLSDSPYERLYLICLDKQKRLLKAALLGMGSVDEVTVYPRVAVETALRHRASGVILAHNHPSGGVQPSAGDVRLTQTIGVALGNIGITLFDHIIVAQNKYISLAGMGLISGGF